MNHHPPTVTVFDDLQSLSRAAADYIVAVVEAALADRSRCTLALAGGRTPRSVYELLASAYRDRIAWERVHLFWGDERYVPADDPNSNERMARESLIARVPIPAANVHAIATAISPPARAAAVYDAALRQFFGADGPPVFDLVLLGVGEDGHTASLFPDDPALEEHERWAVAVTAPRSYNPRERITLTLPVLNAARAVLLLASGAEKADALAEAVHDPSASERLPIARVSPAGDYTWYLDRWAAARMG